MMVSAGTARAIGLVGRTQELDAVGEHLSDAGSGTAALVLEGPAGIGKSAIWEQALAVAGQAGMRVLRARASLDEQHFGFAGLADLLTPLGEELLAALPGTQARALEASLLLSRGDQEISEHTVAAATLTILRTFAREGPVVVAIDDVPWLDHASTTALAFAARRLELEPVRFLFTARTPAAGGETPLERALHPQRIVVAPMSFGAIGRLVQQRLGLSLRRSTARWLYETAAGNPLFALELSRVLDARGSRPGVREQAPLPTAIGAALGENLEPLTAPVRQVLVAAELGGGARCSDLEELLGADAVQQALDGGVVERDGQRLRPSHPLIGAVAVARTPAAERRAMHHRLATVAPDAEHRARHLALATPGVDDQAGASVAAAATGAMRRGAVATAVELAEQALRLTPPHTRAHDERLVLLAEYLNAAGELQRVFDLLEPAVGSLEAPRLRTLGLSLLAETANGPISRAYRYRVLALAAADGDVGLRASVLAGMATSNGIGEVKDLPVAEAQAREALELALRSGKASAEHAALSALIWMRHLRGHDADEMIERGSLLERESTVLVLKSVGRARAVRMMWRGELEHARTTLFELLLASDERGETESYFAVRLQLCELLLRAGEWDAVDSLMEEWSLHPEEAVGSPAAFARMAASLAVGRGEAQAARAAAREGIELAGAIDAHWHRLESLRALGTAELLAGEAEDAARALAEAWEHLQRNGVGDPGAFPLAPDLIESLLAAAQPERAGDVLAVLERQSEQQRHPWGLAGAARGRGLVALSAGRQEEAIEQLGSAVSAYGEMGMRFERARTLGLLGLAHRRAKQIGRAREVLQDSIGELEEIGSPGWARRSREELARLGGRRRSEGLTPTERRVAELVAGGRANKEVAAELVVSISAVERHLTRIYAKLGVRSRTEMASRLVR